MCQFFVKTYCLWHKQLENELILGGHRAPFFINGSEHCYFWPSLRGAWRDHCFPEPFSYFLHETGLESLKITSTHCFLLKCQRKDSKKAKEHRQFRGVLGRWRTATINRTTFHACQRCRKTAVFAVFSRLWGVIWRGNAFRDQQCQFLTGNKSLSSENESNSSMTYECVRTGLILPRGAGLEHGRCKQSIFSLSIIGMLVERLSFQRLHFCSDFVTVFFIFFIYARAKIRCYSFFNFDLRKKLCFVKADRVG